jgi:predicted Zn-dependent protease
MGGVNSYGQNTVPTQKNDKKPKKKQSADYQESQLALQYYRDQKYDKAAEIYKKLYANSQTHVYYTYLLYSLIQLNDFKEAEKLAKKQIRKYPDKLRYLVDMGYVYISSEESAKGKKYYELALNRLKPEKNDIIQLANAFLSKRETEYAIKTYEKGREMLQYAYPFHLEMARIYEQTANYEGMFSEYLDMIEYDGTQIATVQNKLQTTLGDDPDDIKNEIFRITLLKRIQKYPDRAYYSEMLLWYSIQRKDFKTAFIQAKALDRRFGEEGVRVYNLANLSASNKDYDVAIEAYNYIINMGESGVLYISSRVELLNVSFIKITSSFDITTDDLIKLEKEFIATLDEFGLNPTTLSLVRNLAHLHAFYLDKTPEAIQGLYEAIALPNIAKQHRAECKLELADILLFSGEPWEATLLYSQVEKEFKHDPIGHEAKFRNAKLTYYIGEFDWAKAQLDVLKAATSKLIANDAMHLSLLISDNIDADSSYRALELFSKADLYMYRNKDDQALEVLDSITLLYTYHPISDEVLYKKAEILIKNGKFEDADTILAQIVTTYPYDILADNALFKRAQLWDFLYKDADKAMELYQELLVSYPGSLFAVESRKRFRELRGDELN